MSDFKSDGFMYGLALCVAVFVIAQSVFFLVRAVKRAKQLGISNSTIKDTITSSALFSVAPAFSICITVLLLSVALGIVLPWIRLSVIGAISYEVPAAEAAIEAYGMNSGISQEITDPKAFATIAWVMTLGSVLPLVLIPIVLKKVQSKVSGVANKNGEWTDLMSSAAFIGLISAFVGRSIAGKGSADVVGDGAGVLSVTALISAVLFMLLFSVLIKKMKWKWLEPFAMPLSMFLALFVVLAVIKVLPPEIAYFEWRS